MQRVCHMLLLSLMLCSVTMGSRADSSDEAFVLGWKVGQVDMHEAKILEAFLTIQSLENEEGERIERIVSTKKRQIDGDLLSLAMYSEEIDQATRWPDELRAVVLLKSSNLKATMHRLREARRVGEWEYSDAVSEKAIQRVFDKYEEFGNLLEIESN